MWTTLKEVPKAPKYLVSHKSRTPFQSPPSSFTTENRNKAFTAVDTQDTCDLDQQETTPAACSRYCKKKHHMLVVGDSRLKVWRLSSVSVTGSLRSASSQELRSGTVPRGCHSLSRARTAIHSCYFMWV